MQNLSSAEFVDAVSQLSKLAQCIAFAGGKDIRHESSFVNGRILPNATDLDTTCGQLGLATSKASAERLLTCLLTISGKPLVGGEVRIEAAEAAKVRNYTDQLIDRVRDELGQRIVLVIPADQTENFRQKKPLFGADVANKFPSAAFEADEAGKCLALARYVASVFHLMRVLEIGINAVRSCLGIPDPVSAAQRNWGSILKVVKAEIDRRSSATPKLWSPSGDREIFEGAYALLDAVRNVWRNTTMHVENRYTEAEATQVLGAVRAFMGKLASRMDESGQPRA